MRPMFNSIQHFANMSRITIMLEITLMHLENIHPIHQAHNCLDLDEPNLKYSYSLSECIYNY